MPDPEIDIVPTLISNVEINDLNPIQEPSIYSNEAINKRENLFGITAFINSQDPGFNGIVKQRYSDFLVNEIDLSGNLVKLTETQPTLPPVPTPQEVENEKKEEISLVEIFDLLSRYVGQNASTQIQKSIDSESPFQIDSMPIPDKIQRTSVHEFFKTYFKNQFTTQTCDSKIRITKSSVPDQRDKKRSRNGIDWRLMNGNYCEFVLYKENKDNMDAIGILSGLLRIPRKSFSFAGTKDKRGITVQKMTAFKTSKESLIALNSKLKGLQVGNCSYVENELRLGDLNGNQFQLIIREIDESKLEVIETRLKSLQTTGFINYYGLQRFGTGSISTHEIGIAIINSEWKTAIDFIMDPKPNERQDIKLARQKWFDEKDAKSALNLFPRQCTAERSILEFFSLKSSKDSDLVGALNSIPRTLRSMYVHAYQSYVWNYMVTMRIEKYGLSPIKGDLVLIDKKPKILDIQDLDSYSIQDIVLPLPGFDIQYPENEMKSEYESFMKTHGIDCFNMKRKIRDYSLPGDYRKIIGTFSQFSWEMKSYNDVEKKLLLSDLDLLKGETLEEEINHGDLKALKVCFVLNTSSYATMAIRELMKTTCLID